MNKLCRQLASLDIPKRKYDKAKRSWAKLNELAAQNELEISNDGIGSNWYNIYPIGKGTSINSDVLANAYEVENYLIDYLKDKS